MSGKLIIMGGLALAFGATSYYAGNEYLDSQTQARLSAFENNRPVKKKVELKTIVVAKARLKFGQTLDDTMLKEIPWPADHKLDGSFAEVSDLVGENARRVVSSIEPGEPILAIKLTGENGRAGLAGIIAEGMRAVTIPVNMVDGVGGFVQPGDRVDIVFTHQDQETEKSSARIIMSNIKVLSVDQQANQRSEAAQIAKSVTLETDTKGAQKLALARNVGTMSLLLRSAGDDQVVDANGVSADELGGKKPKKKEDSAGGLLSFLQGGGKKTASIRVVRRDVVESATRGIGK